MNETSQPHVAELRRGTVVLACLALLEQPHYGYDLLTRLEEAGVETEANTLYPLLRRLEQQGLLGSEWNTEQSRPRKFYATTDDGRAVLADLRQEWTQLDTAMTALAKGTDR